MESHIRKQFVLVLAVLMVLSALGLSPAKAQSSETLQEVLQLAVISNPDVQEKWHAFQAAGSGKKVAEAGFGPTLDFTAGIGRDSIDGKAYEDRDFSDYSHNGVSVTLRQMIYDGGLTRNQVKRLDHVRMVRYYELLSAMESVSLETVRAYEDVVRYRRLEELAGENYARHQEVMEQVRDRVEKGYDSRSSLEEIRGRLAVARVNLLTEQANVHDVNARYERIVGELPAEKLKPFDRHLAIPSCADEAHLEALSENPALYAARENVLATDAALEEKLARLRPNISLRGGYNSDHDVDGVEGRKDKWYGEVVLTYNLYDGGARRAAVRQHEELAAQSEKKLETTGRDIRQSLKVAYNDIGMLEAQLPYLEEHRSASNEVRKAYSEQFRIGRRDLLDLLDVENEYYQASRAWYNAEFNVAISRARVLASMGKLTEAFGVAREDVPTPGELGIEASRYECGSECERPGIESPSGKEAVVETSEAGK